MPTDSVPIGLAPELVEVQQNEFTTTQVEQVLKAHDDLLNELNSKNNDNAIRVMTRCENDPGTSVS